MTLVGADRRCTSSEQIAAPNPCHAQLDVLTIEFLDGTLGGDLAKRLHLERRRLQEGVALIPAGALEAQGQVHFGQRLRGLMLPARALQLRRVVSTKAWYTTTLLPSSLERDTKSTRHSLSEYASHTNKQSPSGYSRDEY